MMKRTVPWLVGLACVGVAGGFFVLRGNTPALTVSATEPGKNPAAPAAGTPAAAQERIAYTFADDAKIREFTELWQQRVGSTARMMMLQGYWNSEQAELAKLNTQLQSQYQLEPSKDYYFDKEKRALMERPAPEAAPAAGQAAATPPPAQPQEAAPPVPAAPAQENKAGIAVHTFANDEELRGFATLWQQRQGMVVRMAVLQDYWKGEQNALTQLNSKLAADYGLDGTKDYVLDSKRRVLIERPAPQPAAPQPAAAPNP